MERQKKTNGIVIRRFNLNEADQIVTVLTENEGKVSLLAKGSRRLKSKFCGRLEPFYHVSLNYFQGRELGHLDEAEILEVYSPLESDLRAKSILFFMAEITAKLVADGQECLEVYQLLNECLREFEDSHSEIILHAYMVKLLTLLGFMAPWDSCSRSNIRLNLTEPLFLSARDASVVRSGYNEPGDVRLTPSVIRWVNYMQNEKFSRLKLVTPSPGEKAEVYYVMRIVFGNILNTPFRSEAFLHAVSR
ncbi:DNA repair protein RecO [Patescibacteria group bacterium]|nr:DNA repair protein RecO [Patescibacteria group bacterium]MBU1016036.1 DNA repair protein RecO [Patescibacteria group bacterium]MBU1685546.1 DNA repair protein RecO [Patescibacteria group bacterium]MBU1938257.1 DNA repair protein RecO [Patescibacteria group bacterium]